MALYNQLLLFVHMKREYLKIHVLLNRNKCVYFRQVKLKKENSWFEKAAKEMDMDLDEDQLYPLYFNSIS